MLLSTMKSINKSITMAQETLEEAADKYFPFADKMGGETYTAYRGFITGAKWQQEQEKKLNSLNLDELESKLDNSLSKETTESLTEWLDSKSVDDELTDDEWVIKELKKEIESLYTKEQMQEAILQILEYVVEKMGKKEKMNTREKSKEIIESFKK